MYNVRMANRRLVRTTLLFLSLVAAGLAVGLVTAHYYRPEPRPGDIQGLFWPDPKQLYPFVTIDDSGHKFTLDRLEGKWSFLFFGYTHCPDVCPLTLSVMNQAYRQLQQQGLARDVQMIFVTVDPGRDTSQRLAGYVHQFNPDFTGLGGSKAQVRSLATQVGVSFVRGETAENGDYLVDHSAALFLIDPQGRLVSLFSPPLKAGDIVSRFGRIRAFLKQQT